MHTLQLGSIASDFILPLELKANNEAKKYSVSELICVLVILLYANGLYYIVLLSVFIYRTFVRATNTTVSRKSMMCRKLMTV
jgi:hypothetical protein